MNIDGYDPHGRYNTDYCDDDDTCQHCHEEARDREDSPWCAICRVVEREYDQERKDDR